jgi:hypothetical protein
MLNVICVTFPDGGTVCCKREDHQIHLVSNCRSAGFNACKSAHSQHTNKKPLTHFMAIRRRLLRVVYVPSCVTVCSVQCMEITVGR